MKTFSRKAPLFRGFAIAFSILFAFASCKTTGSLEPAPFRDDIEQQENVIGNNENYIFLRLYNPIYKDLIDVGHVIKTALESGETTGVKVSHSAVNFSLNDNFYGLTTYNKNNLSFEVCSDEKPTNRYMKKCDFEKSTQYTYALKVSPEEYKNAKDLVEYYYNSQDIDYSMMEAINFGRVIMFRKGKVKKLEKAKGSKNVIYTPGKMKNDFFDEEFKAREKDFVCCTFVSYVLQNTVKSVHDYFKENDINYDFVSVSDLAKIPGVELLYSSNWLDYWKTTLEFIKEHPEYLE
ncbi:MAG: hypothetical protein KBT11_06735 [Treponema sp.]|nr:hypothetical protein [Candidatus Treponema equifaecale]